MWKFHPNKTRTMRLNSKVDCGYVYNITIENGTFQSGCSFQHIMFIKYYNSNPDRLKILF
ncbi:hypothetical protein NBO_24g0024 [Nosema bombycis CQ1]|uniref:Uncharacterized protein n=1 Tax=Nosema bombycis (strain CQ1 / CVCC 102059) TaxID=578461 RepID=R0M9C3_NOSB1|nr:hypothetical protein NBO_24g0024 [Nosema bombycis CQ1]|eukprot:EOB14579.1 hypothetical protein NBO_24g0024 [Nosema bombycis CQ1]